MIGGADHSTSRSCSVSITLQVDADWQPRLTSSGPAEAFDRSSGGRGPDAGMGPSSIPEITDGRYNQMVREPLASDTSIAAEHRQIERWRGMTAGDKLLLAVSLSQAVDQLALAGIVRRYPAASTRERFLRLAVIRLGRELATQAYPEIAALHDP